MAAEMHEKCTFVVRLDFCNGVQKAKLWSARLTHITTLITLCLKSSITSFQPAWFYRESLLCKFTLRAIIKAALHETGRWLQVGSMLPLGGH